MITSPAKRIGFLATGSELTTGEILNTNGQRMAQRLLEHGAEVGEHLVVDDRECNLTPSLKYILEQHDAIIISGGLGPTSDDRTRFVLAKVIEQDLVFNEESWQRIVDRLSKRNIPIPENNMQQALFPEIAIVMINPLGTADGCFLKFKGKPIFMLPGPPRECLPMFENHVLPALQKHGFFSDKRMYRWRLMGVSESAIAEQLEEIGKPFELEFGYRAAYPYIDIKLMLDQNESLNDILLAVDQVVHPYLVTTENLPVSKILQNKLKAFNGTIHLNDQATHGALLTALSSPETRHKVIQSNDQSQFYVELTGLDNYWSPQADDVATEIKVSLKHNGEEQHASKTIYLRGDETLEFAVEYACHCINQAWFKD